MAEKKKLNEKTWRLIKQIVAISLTALIIVGFAIGDWICYIHESEITGYLSPDNVLYDTSNVAEALGASEEIVQQIAGEGITMLKNNGTLPLNVSSNKNINLFGTGATDSDNNGFYVFGKGSGSISTQKEDVVFPKQGFEEAGFSVNENLYNFFRDRDSNPSEAWWSSSAAASTLNYAKVWSDTAVVFISRFTGENANDLALAKDVYSESFGSPWKVTYTDNDQDGRNYIQLAKKEETMINWCAENFQNVIVVINSGNVMELGALDNAGVDAVLYCPYTGQSGAKQIAEIIAGNTNPSGHLTDTFMYDITENPSYLNAFMQTGAGTQIAYTEDIYVGYKWYETADYEGYFTKKAQKYDEVVWRPFGYGLSYTSFEWSVQGIYKKTDEAWTPMQSGDQIAEKNATVRVSVEVKNTGSRAGKDVVQLYANAPYTKGGIEKAYLVLAAFGKTDMLYPAAQADDEHPNSQVINLEFDMYSLASYDAYDKNKNNFCGWELEQGLYTMSLRTDVHTLDDCTDAEFTFNVPTGGFRYDKDPVTGNDVVNRFTGDKAEAGVPIDGSKGGEPITYLSRADFAGTFPTAKFALRTSGYDVTKNGTYVTDEEYYSDVTMPTLNSTDTQYLLFTREDGSKATSDDLNRYSGNTIVPNEELIMKLGADYNAPEWEQMLNQMSYLEICIIVTQCGCGTASAVSIGKPRDMVFDGPEGLANSYLSPDALENVTGFPAEAMVGMTWNADLARQEGAAMGYEVAQQGVIGMYAPAVDLHRHPFNGRNFEQYGEDPLICGIMGSKAAYGLLTQGIQCSVKHFVCSTPGMNPRDYNTWLTEQNLRENYLRPFERCVKDAEANFIMTSFNNIGGVRCAYSYQLNNGVLRSEWGFKGSIITDYDVNSPSRTTASLIRSGNDLRFQSSVANRAELSENNAVDVYLARQSVKNSLYSFCNSYYRAKTYNPNYTVADITIIPGFPWWIPVLVVFEVLALAGMGLYIFRSFVPRKRKVAAGATEEEVPTTENEPTMSALPAQETAPMSEETAPAKPVAEAPVPKAAAPEAAPMPERVEGVTKDELAAITARQEAIEKRLDELMAKMDEALKPKASKPKSASTTTAKKTTSSTKKSTSATKKSSASAKNDAELKQKLDAIKQILE